MRPAQLGPMSLAIAVSAVDGKEVTGLHANTFSVPVCPPPTFAFPNSGPDTNTTTDVAVEGTVITYNCDSLSRFAADMTSTREYTCQADRTWSGSVESCGKSTILKPSASQYIPCVLQKKFVRIRQLTIRTAERRRMDRRLRTSSPSELK